MTGGAPRTESRRSDDSGYGLAMFVIFSAAALIVTGAVALLALVSSWWMLGVAFAVHVGMTSVVTYAVLRAIDGRAVAVSDRARSSAQDDRGLEVEPRNRGEVLAAR
jgi:membrane protein implicated in regulation of membrane protease activity